MAPRVLIANSLLVPDWADWETFRRLEAEGLVSVVGDPDVARAVARAMLVELALTPLADTLELSFTPGGRKAIELDETYAEAHYNLAVLYLERQPPAIELARRHLAKSSTM